MLRYIDRRLFSSSSNNNDDNNSHNDYSSSNSVAKTLLNFNSPNDDDDDDDNNSNTTPLQKKLIIIKKQKATEHNAHHTFLSSSSGCQLLVTRVVSYCNSLDVIRLSAVCSSIYSSFNGDLPRSAVVWKSLLASEWCVDVDALERLHIRSLERTKTYIRASVHDEDGEGDGSDDPEEEEGENDDENNNNNNNKSVTLNNNVNNTTMVTPPRLIMRQQHQDPRRAPFSPPSSVMATTDHQDRRRQYDEENNNNSTPVKKEEEEEGDESFVTPEKQRPKKDDDEINNTSSSINNNTAFSSSASSSSATNNNNNNLKSPIRNKKLLSAPPPFDWKGLLKLTFKFKVTYWLKHLSSMRDPLSANEPTVESMLAWIKEEEQEQAQAQAQEDENNSDNNNSFFGLQEALEKKIFHLESSIEAQIQSGLLRGQIHHRNVLGKDLYHQALMLIHLAKITVTSNNNNNNISSSNRLNRKENPTDAEKHFAALSCPVAEILPLAAFPQREFASHPNLIDIVVNHPAYIEMVKIQEQEEKYHRGKGKIISGSNNNNYADNNNNNNSINNRFVRSTMMPGRTAASSSSSGLMMMNQSSSSSFSPSPQRASNNNNNNNNSDASVTTTRSAQSTASDYFSMFRFSSSRNRGNNNNNNTNNSQQSAAFSSSPLIAGATTTSSSSNNNNSNNNNNNIVDHRMMMVQQYQNTLRESIRRNHQENQQQLFLNGGSSIDEPVTLINEAQMNNNSSTTSRVRFSNNNSRQHSTSQHRQLSLSVPRATTTATGDDTNTNTGDNTRSPSGYRDDMTNDEILDVFFDDLDDDDDDSSSSSTTPSASSEKEVSPNNNKNTNNNTITVDTPAIEQQVEEEDDQDNNVSIMNDDLLFSSLPPSYYPSSAASPLHPIDQRTLLVCPHARELLQRALGNLAMIQLLLLEEDPRNNNFMTQHAHTLATEITLCIGSSYARTSQSSFATSYNNFDFDAAYDDVQCNGSSRDRAAFFFQCEFWRGPSFTLKMQQYSVCDVLRFWPEKIIRQAYRYCKSEAERLCCSAWMSFDRNDIEGAQRQIDIACSLIPVCKCSKSLGPLLSALNNAQQQSLVNNNKTKPNTMYRSAVPTEVEVLLEKSEFLPTDAERNNFEQLTTEEQTRLVQTLTQQAQQRQQERGDNNNENNVRGEDDIPIVAVPPPSSVPIFKRKVTIDENTNECPDCKKPLYLRTNKKNNYSNTDNNNNLCPSDAFIFFSAGFIGCQSPEALKMYFISLRSTLDVGRRSIICNNIGTIFHHFKDYETSAAWHEAGVALNRNYYMNHKNLARCCHSLGSTLQANVALSKALKLCRPLPAEAFSERAKYTAMANRELPVTMKVNPRYSYPYRLRAALIMDSGASAEINNINEDGSPATNNSSTHRERTRAELNQILNIKLEPNDLSLRAAFARDGGEMDKAIESMRFALTLQPDAGSFLKWMEKYGEADKNLILEEFDNDDSSGGLQL